MEVRQVSSGSLENQAAGNEVRSIPMRMLGDLAVVTLPEMRSNFQLRAVGGDDTSGHGAMYAWPELPGLTEQVFRVEPPEYSGQPARELVGQRIEVLSGTRVTFRVKFTGPMRSVMAQSMAGASSSPLMSAASTAVAGTASSTSGVANTGSPISTASASMTAASANDGSSEKWKATLSSDGTGFELFTSADEAVDRARKTLAIAA